jgi:uncharacterized membrane protein YdbT with pleckstrin-like domain
VATAGGVALATLRPMPFPEDALAAHEKLVLNLHPHAWVLARSAGLLVLTVALGVLALAADLHVVLKLVVAAAIVAAAGWFLSRFAVWYATYFVLTSDRVIYRAGVFTRESTEIPLERINTVFSSQSIFERLLRIGDVEIESASTDGAQRFADIRRPADVQKEIYVQMESNENRHYDRIGDAAHSAGSSITDQITKLADLRDRGAISDAEFQAKKTELLGRL